MSSSPHPNLPKRYGRNTPVTAPGPRSGSMVRQIPAILRNPLPFLEDVSRQCGAVVQFPIPRPATYLVNSPEGAREVLINSHRVTNKQTIQYTTLSLVTGEGLLTADGEAWLPRRRMLQPAFHKELLELVDRHISRALAKQDEQWQQLCRDGSAVIDVDQAMMSLALDITVGALFGIDLDEQTHEITQATLTALHGVVARARNPLALPLRIPTLGNVRMRRAITKLDHAVALIIEHRKNQPLPHGAPIRDMLDLLLDQDRDVPLTHKQVRDEIATFIVAGHETVASALTWSWHLLGQHPDEFASLRQDSQRAQFVFDEALRLYPPAWVITRTTAQDLDIHGVRIPSGSLVIVSPWIVHRQESAWKQPNQFLPDRFADGVPQIGYLPFGAGPRLCIGRDMARLEGSKILAHMSQQWNLRPVREEVPVEASVTLRPRHGLPMKVSRL